MGTLSPDVEKEFKALRKELAKLAEQVEKNRVAIGHNAKVTADALGGVVKQMADVRKDQIRKSPGTRGGPGDVAPTPPGRAPCGWQGGSLRAPGPVRACDGGCARGKRCDGGESERETLREGPDVADGLPSGVGHEVGGVRRGPGGSR